MEGCGGHGVDGTIFEQWSHWWWLRTMRFQFSMSLSAFRSMYFTRSTDITMNSCKRLGNRSAELVFYSIGLGIRIYLSSVQSSLERRQLPRIEMPLLLLHDRIFI